MNKKNKKNLLVNITNDNFYDDNKINCINKCNNEYVINPITFNISLFDKNNDDKYCSIFPFKYLNNIKNIDSDINKPTSHRNSYNDSDELNHKQMIPEESFAPKANYSIYEFKKCNNDDLKIKNNYTNPMLEMIPTKIWLKIYYNIESFDDTIDIITKKYIHDEIYYDIVERIMEYSLKSYHKEIFLLNDKSINVFLYIIKNRWISNILKYNGNININNILKDILSIDYISNFVVNFIQNNKKKIKKMKCILNSMKKEYISMIDNN